MKKKYYDYKNQRKVYKQKKKHFGVMLITMRRIWQDSKKVLHKQII